MTSQPCNGQSFVQTQKKGWTSQWSVILRTFYRQILSWLYSSFFFWNFRHRLARELLVFTSILGEMIQFDWYSFDGLKPPTRGSLLRVLSPAIGGLLLGTNISPTSWALLSDSQILLFPRWDRWNSVEGNNRREICTPIFWKHPNGEFKS